MTTTLRPTGPEEPRPGGGRLRHWQVWANGRAVGKVLIAEHLGTGRIEGLEITEARRRGRGTVAALAAEEVLRGWGCHRVEVSVPTGASAGHRLARALGYTETSHHMHKRLSRPPLPRPELTTRPIGPEEFQDWLDGINRGYRDQLRRVGLTERQAAEKVAADVARLLPSLHATPGMAVHLLLVPGEPGPAGSLWLSLDNGRLPPDDRPLAWVMNVEVEPGRRGRGYGRELMLTAERLCLAAGVHDLGLNVYAANEPAHRLYESLGYRLTRRQYAKPL
ncbi:GNAT family N-acetyltransferase [Kitasatospora viridis]|uniref:Acetyltransferase (GNAT) family protein n=1 Tax=Kitasatospora viridis TaxID=281105 RepID=A0A561UAM2_9ACTN|nr:GNAT family N-acetyltransferase [Kitasatospora viridis]TWF96407.1 acetyltransferase (GNAT) family protein [Kitasatospora viridis]